MAQAKEEAITKILSFNYAQLEDWMRSRLYGDDKYFSLYSGYETNLSGFLANAFAHIKDDKFRYDFLEILHDMVVRLKKFSKVEIEEEKEYIYELLSLCADIKRFEKQLTLMEIAESGKFKGIEVGEQDLHLVLLTTLQSFQLGGNYRFWIAQMEDDSNKYYTNAAFFALLKHRYSLDILFKHIKTFIDRFKDDILLSVGIEAMFDYHDPQEISRRFKKLKRQLSRGQREAINNAFTRAGYTAPYKRFPGIDIPVVYGPIAAGVSLVREKTSDEEVKKYLLKKAAEIFREMGFLVDTDYRDAGQAVALFIKRKRAFVDKYECYVCECGNDERKVNKNEIRLLSTLRELVRKELEEQKSNCTGCDAIYIALMGFTKGAIDLATEKGIILKTITELERELEEGSKKHSARLENGFGKIK